MKSGKTTAKSSQLKPKNSKLKTPPRPAAVAPTDERLGRAAYCAYAASRAFKSIDGQSLPAWEVLKTGIQLAWIAAAKAVLATDQKKG